MAHDGTLLKLSFAQQTAKTGGAKPKSASQTTLGSMKKNLISAKAAFQKQLDDDGWAGDVADGVSALWGSKNRASVIRKELAGEQDRLNQLAQAAQKGDANFKTKFKQIYGVEYNKQAVEAYNKKPNAANFKKAYGSKYPDIRARVNEYNKSQQEGAEVVKTSAKVTTGVAIGVATGGAGLVALGVAAGATTLASAGVEYSDRYKWTGGGGLRKGTSHKKIWKGAAWDGLSVAAGGAVGKIATTAVNGTTMAAKVGRGAINVAGDTGVGAAQEYSETGKVTVTGVVTNATMGGVGSAVTSGVLKEAKAKIVRNFSSKTKNTPSAAQTSTTTTSQTKTNLNENEASHMASDVSGKKTSQNNDISHDKASNDDTALAAFLAKKKAELRAGQKAHDITTDKVDTTSKNTENYVVNEDGSVTKVNNVSTDSNKSAIATKMQELKSKKNATSTATERPEVIGKGHIFDKNTGKVIKVNPEKIKIETNGFGISLNDEFGNVLGSVQTDKELIVNGKTYLHFEGLKSNVDGLGIGTKLIRELEKKSFELGHEGRLIATASPFPSTGTKKPLTNLGFYYKLGFKATDSKIDKQITQCIREGKDIPLSLNSFVQIEYIPKKGANVATGHTYNENGELLAGGSFFHKISVSNLFGSSKTKLSKADLMNQAEKNIAKQTKLGDPGTVHISRKLHDELRSPMIAKEFPSAIDLNNINAHIKSGEVCAVGSGANQKLYVNNNGTAQEIQLSRETFDRLFPQGGFAMTSQKAKNNCWILSKINAMTGSNTGKAELYSMFKELPNGDVQILLPNSNRPITFPKGKPLETNSARQIKEGGAPGVEMVQQAVQTTRIQKAEKTPISNIEDCSIEKLNVQEELMGTDPEAVSMLIDNKKFTLKTINDNQYAELEDVLNNFNAKEDIGTVTFEMHARTLVAYNPRTKMVTYHNPYNGGVDITCRLEDLERKFANFAISKPKQKITANNTTTKTVSEQTQNTVQQATTKPKTGVEVPKSAEQKTKIVRNNFREIAKAADGTPINAMISGDSIVINKNGNNIEIPLSEIKENSFYKNSEVSLYSVNETSTNSYIVIEADKYGTISTRSVKDDDGMYKLMDELDQKAKQKTNSTVTDTNSSTEKVSEHIQSAPTKQKSRVDLNSKSKPGTTQTHNKTSSRLAVPKGFIVNQEVNGRRTLISTDGNARVLMERNGRWMEVNNRGRLIEFTE